MKKINLLAMTVILLLAYSQVFGGIMLKSAALYGDSVPKCPDVKVEVKDIEASKVLAIKATVPSAEVGQKIGELLPKLAQYAGGKGIQMAGPPYSKYYSWDPQGDTEMEVGIPVAAEAEGEGEIEYVEIPAMKVATALHIGTYESIGTVYEAIQKYIDKKGLKVTGAVWEAYLTDPGIETDPNKYKTQVYYPVE